MGLYIVTLQGTASSLSKSPAVYVPPRKYLPNIMHSEAVVHSSSRVCSPTSALALS